MTITRGSKICVWNILRYALRLWSGQAKDHDLEEIAHYAEMAWSVSVGRGSEERDKGS